MKDTIRICSHCGKPFPSKAKYIKYCSDPCRKEVKKALTKIYMKARRKRNKEEKKNKVITDFNKIPYGVYLKAVKEGQIRLQKGI